MQYVLVFVTLLASALSVARDVTSVSYGPPPQKVSYGPPPQKSYILPPQKSYILPPQKSYILPPQKSYITPPRETTYIAPQVPPPQKSYISPPRETTYIAPQVPPPQKSYITPPRETTYIAPAAQGADILPAGRPSAPGSRLYQPAVQQQTQPSSRPYQPAVQQQTQPSSRTDSGLMQLVPAVSGAASRLPAVSGAASRLPAVSGAASRLPAVSGAASRLPTRYTQLDYSDSNAIELNRNPGTGRSGPLGVFVGACSASMVCVPEAMCNPYTGFVRGGLLREPTGPSSQPTVALLRCYRLKDGGVGDGVCCRMPHINDPWPDFQ